MKLRVGLLAMCLSLNVFAGAGGHGGDPYITHAVEFPDSAKLESGINLALEKINASLIPEKTKTSLVKEIERLQREKKYLYLDAIILGGVNLGPDTRNFLSLGAMTSGWEGSPIYFSKRALSHDENKFTELLVHEVLHHLNVTSEALSNDEIFIDALAKAIMSEETTASLNFALEKGAYLESGIRADQLFDYLIGELETPYCLKRMKSPYICKYLAYKQKLKLNLPGTFWKYQSVWGVVDTFMEAYVAVEVPRDEYLRSFDRRNQYRETYEKVRKLIGKAIVESGREDKQVNFYPYCKVKQGYFTGCPDKQVLLMNDLL